MESNWTEVMNSTGRGTLSPPEDSLVFLLGLLNLGAVTCYSIFSFLFRSETASLDTREFINRKVQSTLDELVLNVHMSTYYNSALQAEEDEDDDEEEESRAHSRRSGRQRVSFFDLPSNSEIPRPSPSPSSRGSKMLKTNSSSLEEEYKAIVQSSQNKLTNEFIELLGGIHSGRQKRSTPKRGTKTGRKSNRTRVLRRRKPTKSTSATVTTAKPVHLSFPSTIPQDEPRAIQESKALKEDDATQVHESMIPKERGGLNPQESSTLNEEGRAIDNAAQIVMQSIMSFDPSTQKRVFAVGNAYPAPAHPAFARHSIRKPSSAAMQALPAIQYIQGLASRTGEASPVLGIHKGPTSLNSPPMIPASVPRSVIGRLIHLIQQTTPLTMDILSIYNGDHQIGRQLDKKCTENLICEMNRQWKRAGNVEAALVPFLSIALSWWSKGNPSNPTFYQVPLPQALMATRAGWMGNNCQVLYPTTQECSPGTKWTLSRTRTLPLVSHIPHPVQVQPPQWQPQPPRTWVTERPQPLRQTQANNEDDEKEEEPKLEEKLDEEEEDEDENVSSEEYSESKHHEERIPMLVTPTPVPAPALPNKPVFQKLPTNWDRRDPGKPAPTATPTQKNDGKPNPQSQYLPNTPPKVSTNTTKPPGPRPSPRIKPDLHAAPVLGLPRNRDILAQPLNKPELSKPQKVTTTTEKSEDEDVSYVASLEEEEDSFDAPSEIKKRVSDGLGNVEVSPQILKNQNLPNVRKPAQEQQQNQQQHQQPKQAQQQQQKTLPNREMVTHVKNDTNDGKTKVTEVSPEPFQPWMRTPIWAGQAGGAGSTSASSSFFPLSSDWVDQVNSGQEERRVPQVFTVDDAVLDSKRQQMMIMQYIRDRSVRPRRM